MKTSISTGVLVALLCATSASAFNFNFDDTSMREVSAEVSPRIPIWQSAKVQPGDTFSQYCVGFLRNSGLHRFYTLPECTTYIKAVNGYTDSQLHWIYPNQIVWLPSPQNVRLGATGGGPFVHVSQLRELLGLDELIARVDDLESEVETLPDEARVGKLVSEATEGMAEKTQRALDELQARVNELPDDAKIGEMISEATEETRHTIDELVTTLDGLPDEARVGELVSEATEEMAEETQRALDELQAKIDTLPDEDRVGEMVLEVTQGVVDTVLPDLITNEVGRQLAEVEPAVPVILTDSTYVTKELFWLVALLLAGLALLAALFSWLRPKPDKATRQAANEAKTTAQSAQTTANEAQATVNSAATKTELEEMSRTVSEQLQNVGQQAATAQETANEAGELAASAMALLCFGDFKVVDGFPSQTAIEKLAPDEEILVTLSHVDNPEDVRIIRFTCVPNAFDDGRDGLKIEGITGQRRPIAKRRSSMASALANGARANHLQGITIEKPKQRRAKSA